MSAVMASPAASGPVRGVPADPVRALQHVLYRAAKADPGRRFHALMDKVIRSDVLWRAWVMVRRNDGAPGTDKVTLAAVEEYGAARLLDELSGELRERRYRPLPARRVLIPKPGTGDVLGSPGLPGGETWRGQEHARDAAAGYDGDGLRATATYGASTQNFTWNDVTSLPQVLMDSGNAYIYTGGVAPAEQVNLATGSVMYLVTDSLGSVRGVVNSTGALTATTSYDAWGNPETTGGLTVSTPFGYAGGYTDPDGLVYLINRYYDPATGQFLSIDPLVAQTVQPYAYANGNPVANIDPSGTDYVRWTVVSITQIAPQIGSWHDCAWVDWRYNVSEYYCQRSVSVSTEVSGSLEIPLARVFSSVSLSVSTGTTTETSSGAYINVRKGMVGWFQWATVQPRYYVNQRKWTGGAYPRGGGIRWTPTNTHAYATITTSGGSTFTFRFVQCRITPRLGATC